MSNSRLTQHLLRGRVGFPTALASSVGLIMVRESEINQEGKARKLWDIEEGKGI